MVRSSGIRRTLARSSIIIAIVGATAWHAPVHTQEPTPAQLREKYAAATAAYKNKDYAAYLRVVQDLARLRPNHPRILTSLASAFALNDRPADVAGVLETLARLNLYVDVDKDPDFARVKDTPDVRRASASLEQVRTRRIGAPEVAWTIPNRLFVPEGVAYDPVSKTFFVSSQYQRKIATVDASGRVKDFVTEGQDGLWMVFGIAVDSRRHWVWAVSTAEREMQDYVAADAGHAGLFAFDIATSKLARKITVEGGDPAHYFDDLTVAADGRVFVSDGGTGSLYTIAPDGRQLEQFLAPGTIQGPNGLALSADGSRLYVSDYAGYIFAVDVATRAATKLPQPASVAMYGIDGLARYGRDLIGVQNGTEPPRVVRLSLAPDGLSIERVTIEVMNDPHMHEPTIGVVAGDDYYFVADSSGTVLRNTKGPVEKRPLTEPTILKVRLTPRERQ